MELVKELPGRLEDAELFAVEGKAVAVFDGMRAIAFLPEARRFPLASVFRNGGPTSRERFDALIEEWRNKPVF